MKCDELKSKTIYEGYPGCYTEHVVYDKDETDEAISEMKVALKIKADLLIENAAALKIKDNLLIENRAEIEKLREEIRHHKRKRCLAMAKIYSLYSRDVHRYARNIRIWYGKLSDKCFGLADKFRG